MQTNIQLIQVLTDNELLRKYAVFLRFKHTYSNSCIYNYSIKGLSCKLGLSRTSIRNNIQFFIDNGWAEMHGNNLMFISHKRLLQLYKIKLTKSIKLKKTTCVTKIVNNLRFELLKNKQRQFEFLKKVSRDLIDPKGKGATDRLIKAKRFFRKSNSKPIPLSENVKDLKLKISGESLGKIIGKSKSTISNLLRLKEQEGKVEITRKKHVLHKSLSWGPDMKGYYLCKGYWIKVSCNQYKFL